jgi:hypothetical protein
VQLKAITANNGEFVIKLVDLSTKKKAPKNLVLSFFITIFVSSINQIISIMKKFFPYFTLLGLTMFAFRTAFVWAIPVKNQMAMALIGVLCVALLILLVIVDISEFIRIKNNQK